MNKSAGIAAVFFIAAGSAGAQQVWRCGSVYQQQPCEGGAQLQVADPRSSSDAAQTRAAMHTDAKLAADMEKTRLAQEKNAPKALVIGAPQAAASAPKAHQPKDKKKAEPDHFTAVTPKK